MSGFALIKKKKKTTTKVIIKRYTEIGSPCLAPLYSLKYSVVSSPLITHDSGFFINICINFRKSLPNPNFFNIHIKTE